MNFLKKIFGEALGSKIKRAGITQSRLAEIMDVEPPSVSRWVSGKSFPDESKYLQLKEILECDDKDFLPSAGAEMKESTVFLLSKVDEQAATIRDLSTQVSEQIKEIEMLRMSEPNEIPSDILDHLTRRDEVDYDLIRINLGFAIDDKLKAAYDRYAKQADDEWDNLELKAKLAEGENVSLKSALEKFEKLPQDILEAIPNASETDLGFIRGILKIHDPLRAKIKEDKNKPDAG